MSRDDIYSVLHLNSFLGFLIASCMTGTSWDTLPWLLKLLSLFII
jgi:hypothetical protein